jgi:hypothetical protein
MSPEEQHRLDAEHSKWLKSLFKDNGRRAIGFNHYHTGYPAMDREEWVHTFAGEEKNNGNSNFMKWIPGKPLPKYLREQCEEFYDGIIEYSKDKYRIWYEASK